MRSACQAKLIQHVTRCLSSRRPPARYGQRIVLTLETLEDRLTPSGNYLLLDDLGRDQVLRYDGATGAFVDTFVPKHSGGLNAPWGILFGPHDGNLYVSTGMWGGPGQLKAVLRYDGTTGAFIDEFAKGGNLTRPLAMIFGPDGNLYVGDGFAEGRVARYDGRTGAYLGNFVPPLSGGLRFPGGMLFGPSGRGGPALDLYVSSFDLNSVLRYDGSTGAFLGEFVASGAGGLSNPEGLTFGPDGNLYVASLAFGQPNGPKAVFRFQGPSGSEPGAFIDEFVPPGTGGLETPLAVLFGPDGNGDGNFDLYVSNTQASGSAGWGKNATVKRYNGVTGAFIDTFVTARSGGLDDSQLMTFTATDPVTLAYTEAGSSRFSAPAAAHASQHANQLAALPSTITQAASISWPVAPSPRTPLADSFPKLPIFTPWASPRFGSIGASVPVTVRPSTPTLTILDTLFVEFPEGLGLPLILSKDNR